MNETGKTGPNHFIEQKYAPIKPIGTGGMKCVELVHDSQIERNVARAIPSETKLGAQARFLEEARLTAQLDHPNIVPIYEIGRNESGEPYFTMKWLQGETLGAILKQLRESDETYRSKYTRGHLLDIFQRVCEAVAFAHSKCIAHLDLKPANIVVSEFGEVYIIDWGLARYFKQPDIKPDNNPLENIPPCHSATHSGLTWGTPGYMAPEQAAGDELRINNKTDVYALGAILHAILTYHAPIEGKDVQQIIKDTIAADIPSSRIKFPDLQIPDSLDAITGKALQRNQDNRYVEVAGLLKDIELYRNGFATSAESAGAGKLLKLLFKRNRTFCLLAGTALTIVIITTAAYILAQAENEKKLIGERLIAQKAQAVAETALSDLKATAPALALLCDDHLRRREVNQALAIITNVVELDPDNQEYHTKRGNILQSLYKFDEATEEYQKALRLAPGDHTLMKNLEICQTMTAEAQVLFLELRSQNRLPEAINVILPLKKKPMILRLFLQNILNDEKTAYESFKVDDEGNCRVRLANVKDLSPWKGFPLTELEVTAPTSGISDLSPLIGMPLKTLLIASLKLKELAPLRGMPLTKLVIAGCPEISDLSPIQGMALRHLEIRFHDTLDLSPLKGMPIEVMNIYGPRHDISDLTVLSDLQKLTTLYSDEVFLARNREFMRGLTQVTMINKMKAADFWKKLETKGP